MFSLLDRLDALLLEWPQRSPPECVDDVVLDQRIELFKLGHIWRRISSTEEAGITFRSSMLSSS
jgi:hypothetical protein